MLLISILGGLLGQLIGALVITFILSRIFEKLLIKLKKISSERIEIWPYLTTLSVCTFLGSFSFGFGYALMLYGFGSLFWYVFHYFRLKKTFTKKDVQKTEDPISILPLKSESSLQEKLLALKNLKEQGLISDASYEVKINELLKAI